jgi:hypothetical protein
MAIAAGRTEFSPVVWGFLHRAFLQETWFHARRAFPGTLMYLTRLFENYFHRIHEQLVGKPEEKRPLQ